MKHFLIIGQGIAGTVLGFKLIQQGADVLFIDAYDRSNATMASAGIMNPITGRSFVKTWKVDTLWDTALKTYRELESFLDINCVYPLELYRWLPKVEHENNWCTRFLDSDYAKYVDDSEGLVIEKEGKRYAKINHAFRVDLLGIRQSFRQFLINEQKLIDEHFDYNEVRILDDHVQYKDIKAQRIIFAEGYKVINNPFFKDLPFRPSRGESIRFKSSDIDQSFLSKHEYFLAPLGNNDYWSGGGYDNNNLEVASPSFIDRIKSDIELRFQIKIEDYKFRSGVRPATKDRRPIIGEHFENGMMYIFNGMGTKGTSLAPYCADRLIEYIYKNEEIPIDININRF